MKCTRIFYRRSNPVPRTEATTVGTMTTAEPLGTTVSRSIAASRHSTVIVVKRNMADQNWVYGSYNTFYSKTGGTGAAAAVVLQPGPNETLEIHGISSATVASLFATNATVTNLLATSETVASLFATVATIGSLNANNVTSKPIFVTVIQAAHGFGVGYWLYVNGTGVYILADATSVTTAEVVGVVARVVDVNTFILQTTGYVSGLAGLSAGSCYFLSNTPGSLGSLLTAVGSVNKPLLVADSTGSGYFTNYRGELLIAPLQTQTIGTLYISSALIIGSSTAASSTATGALIVAGGIGAATAVLQSETVGGLVVTNEAITASTVSGQAVTNSVVTVGTITNLIATSSSIASCITTTGTASNLYIATTLHVNGTAGAVGPASFYTTSSNAPSLQLTGTAFNNTGGSTNGGMSFIINNNVPGNIQLGIIDSKYATTQSTAAMFRILSQGQNILLDSCRTDNGGTYTLYFNTNIAPINDNSNSCGQSGQRWSAVWAANGTIQTSDAREKTDIVDERFGLDFINQLRPVEYRWRNGPDEEAVTRINHGLLAQDITVAANGHFIDYDRSNDRYAMRYHELIGPLIKAVQELTVKNSALTERVEAFEHYDR